MAEQKRLVQQTANDRFKEGFGNWFWGSLAAAVVIHFLIFALWPQLQADDFAFSTSELEAIELPPEIEIPPPPEQIARPATPVISEVELDEDITIAPTTFEDNPIENLPPPPTTGGGDISDAPVFTPYDVKPELRNRAAVSAALRRFYPPLLRDAGVGGTVNVWFFIDEEGRVQNTRIQQSSGHKSLDDAALRVAELMEFSPALNRERRVKVWVALPITFTSN